MFYVNEKKNLRYNVTLQNIDSWSLHFVLCYAGTLIKSTNQSFSWYFCCKILCYGVIYGEAIDTIPATL